MAALAAGGEGQIGAALLKDAHHGEVAGDAADGLPDDAAALVHDQKQVHAPAADLLHQLGTAVAAPLLGAGGGQVHVAVRGIALRKQFLHGLQKGHDGAFGVGAAPAPDLAVFDAAGEGWVLPLAARGDHVLVAHEQDGLFPALAFPIVQQVTVDVRDLQLLMDQGKELLEDLMKGLPPLRLVLTLEGGGVAPDHPGQLFGQGQGDLLRLVGHVGALERGGQQGTHEGDKEQQDDDPKDDANVQHISFLSVACDRGARRSRWRERPRE